MREKISLDTLKWSDTVRQGGLPPFRQLRSPTRTLTRSGPAHAVKTETLTELRERLLNEISRGKEYLAQVRSELHDNRELLDEWAQYELSCAFHPLEHLVESAMLKESVERFLTGWLVSRGKKLQQVLADLEREQGIARAKGQPTSGEKE